MSRNERKSGALSSAHRPAHYPLAPLGKTAPDVRMRSTYAVLTNARFAVIFRAVDPPVFILGTGFGVGKTALACAILRALGERGIAAAGVKPMDTGCTYRDDHNLVSADGCRLRAASSADVPPLVTAPYRFSSRIDPADAAEAAGLELTHEDLLSTVEVAAEFGRAVVEGPGGPSTQLTPRMTTAEFAGMLRSKIFVVGRADRDFLEQVGLTLSKLSKLGIDARAVIPVSPGRPEGDATPNAMAGTPVLPSFFAARDGEQVDDLTRFLETHGALKPLFG